MEILAYPGSWLRPKFIKIGKAISSPPLFTLRLVNYIYLGPKRKEIGKKIKETDDFMLPQLSVVFLCFLSQT